MRTLGVSTSRASRPMILTIQNLFSQHRDHQETHSALRFVAGVNTITGHPHRSHHRRPRVPCRCLFVRN